MSILQVVSAKRHWIAQNISLIIKASYGLLDDLIKYQEENVLPGIVICDAQNIAAQYGIANYPTLFVISPEKRIIGVQIGYDPDMIQNLQQILETNIKD